jgi:hypothetical protein
MFRNKAYALCRPNKRNHGVVHFAVHHVSISLIARTEQSQQSRQTKTESSHARSAGRYIANVLIGPPANDETNSFKDVH